MSPPVISWFFSPALALWPAPHDDVKTTLSDKMNDRSDLDRASPADSLRSSASPSLREGEDVLLACEAESALLLRIRTLLHGLPRNRILRSALHLTSIKLVTGTVAVRLEQSLSPSGLGCRCWLAR